MSLSNLTSKNRLSAIYKVSLEDGSCIQYSAWWYEDGNIEILEDQQHQEEFVTDKQIYIKGYEFIKSDVANCKNEWGVLTDRRAIQGFLAGVEIAKIATQGVQRLNPNMHIDGLDKIHEDIFEQI